MTLPSAVIVGSDVVDDDAAVGVGEAEEGDSTALVLRDRGREGVRDTVGCRPQAVLERFVGVADQGRVGVGVLHQRGRG